MSDSTTKDKLEALERYEKRTTIADVIRLMRKDADEYDNPEINESFTQMEKNGGIARSLRHWAQQLEDVLYGPLAEAAKLAKKYQRVKSPPGTVHAVWPGDNAAETVQTMCNYNAGGWSMGAYEVDWPRTEDRVTCKNCLKAIAREETT